MSCTGEFFTTAPFGHGSGMKIVLLANYLPDKQQSMQRFAGMMESGLRALGHEVLVVRPRTLLGKIPVADPALSKWLGYGDKFLLSGSALRTAAAQADVIHICDQANAFYGKYFLPKPFVVTCHDLIAIRSARGEIEPRRTGFTGRQLQRIILSGINRARHVACVSETTRRDLLRISTVPEAGVVTIYNCLNYPYSPMPEDESRSRLEKMGVSPVTPFYLHVGGNLWYKNRLGVLRIFKCLRESGGAGTSKLLMVGEPWSASLREFVSAHSLGDSVREITGADNEDLRALYSRALALLFPSLLEGFGWPIVEAQACGCPVITSNRAPMTEIGGGAALYVDPENPELAASAIANAGGRLALMRSAGLLNVSRFDTQTMLTQYLALYERAITSS